MAARVADSLFGGSAATSATSGQEKSAAAATDCASIADMGGTEASSENVSDQTGSSTSPSALAANSAGQDANPAGTAAPVATMPVITSVANGASAGSTASADAATAAADMKHSKGLPDGWSAVRHEAPAGAYYVYHGPKGQKVRSKAQAWRLHEKASGAHGDSAPEVEEIDDDDDDEIQDVPAEGDEEEMDLAAVVAAAAARASAAAAAKSAAGPAAGPAAEAAGPTPPAGASEAHGLGRAVGKLNASGHPVHRRMDGTHFFLAEGGIDAIHGNHQWTTNGGLCMRGNFPDLLAADLTSTAVFSAPTAAVAAAPAAPAANPPVAPPPAPAPAPAAAPVPAAAVVNAEVKAEKPLTAAQIAARKIAKAAEEAAKTPAQRAAERIAALAAEQGLEKKRARPVRPAKDKRKEDKKAAMPSVAPATAAAAAAALAAGARAAVSAAAPFPSAAARAAGQPLPPGMRPVIPGMRPVGMPPGPYAHMPYSMPLGGVGGAMPGMPMMGQMHPGQPMMFLQPQPGGLPPRMVAAQPINAANLGMGPPNGMHAMGMPTAGGQRMAMPFTMLPQIPNPNLARGDAAANAAAAAAAVAKAYAPAAAVLAGTEIEDLDGDGAGNNAAKRMRAATNTKRWTPEEEGGLMNALDQARSTHKGASVWTEVARLMGDERTDSALQQHWCAYLSRLPKGRKPQAQNHPMSATDGSHRVCIHRACVCPAGKS